MSRRRILISNDDGVGSPFAARFLGAFADAGFDALAVFPASEQSWIGRAYSRHRRLSLADAGAISGVRVMTVDGTPSDCVNIALGHLFEGGLPDAVVSGINIGQNIGLPLLWSSGTFAAAAEGAGWGLPSFAFSLQLASEYYEICRIRHAPPPPALDAVLGAACAHAASFVLERLDAGEGREGSVHNVNYPLDYCASTEFSACEPASVGMRPLYRRSPDGGFEFKYSIGEGVSRSGLRTDMQCLAESEACFSIVKVVP